MAEVPSWSDLPLAVTVEQGAELPHLHVNTVQAHCRSGKLPASKRGEALSGVAHHAQAKSIGGEA
jgi:hypothetical protein